jgi:hypothetical protein
MSSLLVFNKVYRLEKQSVMLIFSTQLCELLPFLPYLFKTSLPPPPYLCEYVYCAVYTTVCKWGKYGVLGLR